jgi:hypothetical protein
VLNLSGVDSGSSNIIIQNNRFTDIKTGTSTSTATIILPNNENLSGNNYIRHNVFNNTGVSGQNHAIYWDGKDSGVTASHMTIEDNEFDGYKAQSISLRDVGTLTVRRNLFGATTASQSDTTTEETKGGSTSTGNATMVMNYSNSSNRRIHTWYPEDAQIAQCELQVKVNHKDKADSSSFALASTPVTLDIYWTSSRTAEEYLGSVLNVSTAGTYTVPNLPKAAGKIRLQTQGKTDNGQPESSQYSRTVDVPAAPAGCDTPEMSLSLHAWHGSGVDATSYDTIIASGIGSDAELLSGSRVAADEPVWLTYTVANIGAPPLFDVVVRDDQQNPVCVIPMIPPHATNGCWSLIT